MDPLKTPSTLEKRLADKVFAVTSELNPPKGTDLGAAIAKAESLRGSSTLSTSPTPTPPR